MPLEGLWLPEKARPAFRCLICQKPFYAGEERARERHSVLCARRNEDKLRELSPRRGPFDPENWDTEYEGWVRKTGRTS